MSFATRLKKLTDLIYSPTNPASESAIREQIDGSVQEVKDIITDALTATTGSDEISHSSANVIATKVGLGLEEIAVIAKGSNPKSNVYSALDYGLAGLGLTGDTAALNALITNIGATEATILFPSLMTNEAVYLIDANVVFPENINVQFLNGATLKVSNTFSVTGTNTKLTAGIYQIFDLSLGGTIEGNWNISKSHVHWFGAIGNGEDNTQHWQSAIDMGNLVYVDRPITQYLITDSLILSENSMILSEDNGANNYSKALTKIFFSPSSTKDLFILGSTPATYVYGIMVKGLAIKGDGTFARYLFNLPLMSNLLLQDIKGFGGYDYGMVIDGYIDSNIVRCSFQGYQENAIDLILSTIIQTTTTAFHECYFSGGIKGLYINAELATNSLTFNDCTFESLDNVVDITANNNVYMYGCYVENVPKSNYAPTVSAFELGVNGPQINYNTGHFVFDGKRISGLNSALPDNNVIFNVDYWKNLTIANCYLAREKYMVNTTEQTEEVFINNVYTENLNNFGLIYDWGKIKINAFQPISMVQIIDGAPAFVIAKIDNMSNKIYMNEVADTDVNVNTVFVDFADKELTRKDLRNNLKKMGFFYGDIGDTYNGGNLFPGQIIFNENKSKGQPVGWKSQFYTADAQINIFNCITTVGSPIVTASVGTFSSFKIGDSVFTTVGFPSGSVQYEIIDMNEAKTTITLAVNATSSVANCQVYITAHSLLPFGQVGFRNVSAPPTATPNFIGEELLDTTNDIWYKSVGLTSGDWKALNA